MGFMESVKTCLSKYIDFSGRASRSEYWWFFLFTFMVRVATFWIPGVGFIIALALLLPSLSVTARRLHDTNRTGWWMLLPIGVGVAGIIAVVVLVVIELYLLAFVLPVLAIIVGFLTLLLFLIQPSDPHANRYGPGPLQPDLPAGGGYGYGYPDPGYPYAPPTDAGEYGSVGGTYNPPDAPAAAGRRRYCEQCGAERQAEARFCTVCGTGF